VKINFRICASVAAAGALAIAVPAAAAPGSNQPTGKGQSSNHPSGSHTCAPHRVPYIVHGTVDSSQSAITVTDGTVVSGTLMVDVTRTNRWAKADRSAVGPVSYTLGPNTKVKLDGGAAGFDSPDRIKVIGKAPVITNTHCTGAGIVGTPTIRMVVVHPAAS
jgi:hypothetical protein